MWGKALQEVKPENWKLINRFVIATGTQVSPKIIIKTKTSYCLKKVAKAARTPHGLGQKQEKKTKDEKLCGRVRKPLYYFLNRGQQFVWVQLRFVIFLMYYLAIYLSSSPQMSTITQTTHTNAECNVTKK
jgi:hypothetical protein